MKQNIILYLYSTLQLSLKRQSQEKPSESYDNANGVVVQVLFLSIRYILFSPPPLAGAGGRASSQSGSPPPICRRVLPQSSTLVVGLFQWSLKSLQEVEQCGVLGLFERRAVPTVGRPVPGGGGRLHFLHPIVSLLKGRAPVSPSRRGHQSSVLHKGRENYSSRSPANGGEKETWLKPTRSYFLCFILIFILILILIFY